MELVLDGQFWWIRIRLGYLVMGEYVMTGEMSDPTIGQYDKHSKAFRVVGEQAAVPTDRVRPICKVHKVGDDQDLRVQIVIESLDSLSRYLDGDGVEKRLRRACAEANKARRAHKKVEK